MRRDAAAAAERKTAAAAPGLFASLVRIALEPRAALFIALSLRASG